MSFGLSDLGWIADSGEHPSGWSSISFLELEQKLVEMIDDGISDKDSPEIFQSVEDLSLFLESLGLDPREQEEVLRIEINADGIIERALGPAIFASVDEDGQRDGGVVLKIGQTLLPVVLEDDGSATAGPLKGDLEVSEKEGDGGKSYLIVTFDKYYEDQDVSVSVPVILEDGEQKKGRFKSEVKAGNLSKYLKPVPTGGGYTLIKNLEPGQYLLTGLAERDPHPQYGRSWVLQLEGVGSAISSGTDFHGRLAQSAPKWKKMLKKGRHLTFVLSNKREIEQGVVLTCGILEKAPDSSRLVKQLKSAAPTPSGAAIPAAATPVIPVAATPVIEQRELVSAGAGIIDPDEVEF